MWRSIERPVAEISRPGAGAVTRVGSIRFRAAPKVRFDPDLEPQPGELTDRGFRETRIYGSSDGLVWFPLTSPEMIELPRADGSAFGEAGTFANVVAGRPIKSVIIAANDTDGNYGSKFYGLGAVRFVARN